MAISLRPSMYPDEYYAEVAANLVDQAYQRQRHAQLSAMARDMWVTNPSAAASLGKVFKHTPSARRRKQLLLTL